MDLPSSYFDLGSVRGDPRWNRDWTWLRVPV